MFTSYDTSFNFMEGTARHPSFIKSAYARNSTGVNSHIECLLLDSNKNLLSTILSAVPILGTIRGLARLYSVWSVKDRSEDSKTNIIIHTVTGILETLGLGIFILIAKILILALTILVFFTGTKLGLIKEDN
ncbi:hypothetical protein SBV45_03845 [Chlamydia crocodili]|uniref:Uncharacterized protein n=1 Tax=Chlamydia crocodili TaxID=2766982 RepID=A0ABX8CER5_9CHLA|nr:hypothetical protein [Chlamydia crocodili]QVE49111.1 hypothetical protein H9Q19_00065 [Chlamydia crocodili]